VERPLSQYIIQTENTWITINFEWCLYIAQPFTSAEVIREMHFSLAAGVYAWDAKTLPSFYVNPVYGIPLIPDSIASKRAK
jgi:hypothetical protein